ncbi:MAG: hypothetical protein LBH01_11070 [Verrucomicrobiales bacterium]|jgi:beta-mannosidase|nr:hypothetical protein [Verrucomicrobiales bacterium]
MSNQRIDLAGTWQLHRFDGQRGDSLERLLAKDRESLPPLPAPVPGTVHEALLAAGQISEPTLGLNSQHCRWIEDNYWFYRRSFTAPALAGGARAWLSFECLDLAAVIFLNGKEIARHHNYFYPCRVDVTDLLVAGENDLLVQLDCGLIYAAQYDAANTANSFDHEVTKRCRIRKPQYVFGWDWSPRLITVGIPGAVFLEIAETARIRQSAAFSELSADLRRGTITVRAWADPTGNEAELTLTATVPELSLTATATQKITAGQDRLETVLAVDHPELWHPVGHGPQKLYRVDITISSGGNIIYQTGKQLGFRHVRINQDPHPKEGSWFVVEINRKPIFVKGANFVPADLIPSRVTAEKTRALVDHALAANFNCLRVWGGGVYESEEFYRYCDERGLLVWQEFVFACAKYPAHDAGFLHDVLHEARHQVRRLAEHASLFIWCGNNELELANHEWPPFLRPPLHTDHGLFHAELPLVMRREDPSRFYHPSSPFSSPGIPPNDWHSGDQHAWSIGFGDTDFRKYRDMSCRFPNEGGFLGPTALPTMRACLGTGSQRIDSPEWTHHENAVTFWFPRRATDAAIEQWLGLKPGDLPLENFVFWAGLLQGEALSAFIRNFRRRKFDSAGAVFWMYNDAWPSVRSWTIVDYYLRRTPSFHPVRRAFAPILPVVAQEDGFVNVYGVNEGAEWRGRLRFGLCSLATGDYPLAHETEVTLAPNASTLLAQFAFDDWQRLGVAKSFAFAALEQDGRLIAQDRLFLPYFKDIHWPEAKIQIQHTGDELRLTADRFAWNVCLDLDGDDQLSDNFFDLLPNQTRVLPWPRDHAKPRVLHVGNQLGGKP